MTPPPPGTRAEHTLGRVAAPRTFGASGRIVAAVAYVARRLLRDPDVETAIDDVLAELGAATDASRVYIFECAETSSDVLVRQRWEWVAAGIVPQLDNPRLQAASLRTTGFDAWADALVAGEVIVGKAEDFPPPVTALLRSHDVRSVAIVPIILADRLWGFIGFDECVLAGRRWSEAELAALRAAADVVAGALQQQGARDALEASARAHAVAYERERMATDQLRALDAMKDAFLEAVSHELRTPLTAVVGFAETIERLGLLHGTTGDPLISGIRANAGRLQDLVEDLLDLGHLTRGALLAERTDVDVAALIDTVLAEQSAALRDHEVTVRLDVDRAHVDGDKLERVLANLVRNAGRHTEPGVPIAIRGWRADGAFQLAVEDAGGGIPDEHKLSVFEPFRHGPRVSRHSPGTGVGLAVVARYAVAHGGAAWVEDRPGGGTVVRVSFDESDAGSR